MASGYNAGRFNLAFACAAAGATAFALFAMPDAELQAGLDAMGLAGILSAPSGTAARFASIGAAAALAFLLSWLTLRSCDSPVRQTDADAPEDNWPLSLLVSGGDSNLGPENPFAALARGAERVNDSFDRAHAQMGPAETAPVIGDSQVAVQGPGELLARLPYSVCSHAENSDTVQQLNAGLIDSEWPLPAGASEAQAEEMDDRLRNVLQDLQLVARRG